MCMRWLPCLTFLAACWCPSPHVWGAPTIPPDLQYQTGTTHGYDMFVWNCVDGARVVISQYSAEMTCQRAKLEVAPCGARTSLEVSLAGERRRPITRW